MEIFRSRRFWSALVGLVFMVLVAFVPDLQSESETLITAAMVVIGLLIGGYTAEDVASEAANASIVKASYNQPNTKEEVNVNF